jgi:4-diphosphocytidyl-2-C-methyl-D-erythritol kinase
MNSLQLKSPAKLNLFLHITGRRANGYHELQTVFQLLDHTDTVNLALLEDERIELQCSGLDIPETENLAWRAARLLQHRYNCQKGAAIHIDKYIPDGGGLGGGSSNAATVLLGLNQLWGLGLSLPELADLGLSLGADVPVFVHGNSAWAEGIGEILTLTRNTSPITIAAFFEGGGRNDCQSVVRQLYPEVDKALIWLEKFGQAQLTGTGACVFATFESKAEAEARYQQLPGDWHGFVAAGIDHSPVHEALG